MNKNEIFSKEFLEQDFKLISDEVKKNGFLSIDKALSDNFINSVINDVESCGLSLNTNNIAGVYFTHGSQFYLTHMLAVSKSFFDYCTHEKILDICTNYLGNEYRLTSLRYYENLGGQTMQWHTDNRYYDENKKGDTHTIKPGLIILAYLSDVDDGEFQYVKGSHLWSVENQYNDYSNDYIEKNYSKDVVGFKKPKGTIIIYNTFGVHRAKPTKNKNFVRKSLFIQVNRDISHSEPILVKTEYLNKFDERIKLFLGFGKRAGEKIYPSTNLYTMPINCQDF
jgi:ectoine hydroxylase-related dioxygenase (phytanoyl-CoA dioxygenase family)